MPFTLVKRSVAFAAIAAIAAMAAGPAIAAGPVSVSVNGSTVNLSPAPTTRGGRVFVPLRGVFENLGATVVYENGTINATGRGHSVSLKIGSTAATVDGSQQTIDVAPFLIGASTYVPLRFVSQALGATVNYDGNNNSVAINTNGNTNPAPPNNGVLTPAPGSGAANNSGAITLATVLPARGATVTSRRPLIEATFGGGTVDPNSIRITLDTADVTNNSTRSPGGFTFAPQSPLQAGQHRVQVSGNDSNGQPFRRGWGFISGTSATTGQILDVRPANGATVGNQFVVSGRTTPGAHVTVQVGVSSGGGTTIGQIIGSILTGGQQTNSASASLTADGNGNFSTQVNIGAPSGSTLTLVINATDAQTGATATPVQEQLRVG